MPIWDKVGIVLYAFVGAWGMLFIGPIAPMPLGAIVMGAALTMVLAIGVWIRRARRWPLIWLPLAAVAVAVQTLVGIVGRALLGWTG